MTKDVLVSVRGTHIMDRDADQLQVLTTGSYYLKNGKHYIIYDEIIDSEEEAIHNTIRVGEGIVDMIKGGNTRAHMIFKENYSDESIYETVFGQIEMCVKTDKIKINEEPDHMNVLIDYTLLFNHEVSSHSHIEIDVKSK